MGVFVLGAPRTGTTLIGSYIGSHAACADLGEYYGFFLAYSQAPQLMERVPSTVKQSYLESLALGAVSFADSVRRARQKRLWCDHTPWNLLIVQPLQKLLPDATFVLMLRSFRGVVLSLRDSFAAGYRWAGSTAADSARLWATFYENVAHLPDHRTIAVSYDELCNSPQTCIPKLDESLERALGLNADGFDRTVFARVHARNKQSGKPLAAFENGEVSFSPRRPYDVSRWNDRLEAACRPYVADVERDLIARFGRLYSSGPVEERCMDVETPAQQARS